MSGEPLSGTRWGEVWVGATVEIAMAGLPEGVALKGQVVCVEDSWQTPKGRVKVTLDPPTLALFRAHSPLRHQGGVVRGTHWWPGSRLTMLPGVASGVKRRAARG